MKVWSNTSMDWNPYYTPVEQVTVSVDDTLILHGGGDKKLIEERCEQVLMEAVKIQIEPTLALYEC